MGVLCRWRVAVSGGFWLAGAVNAMAENRVVNFPTHLPVGRGTLHVVFTHHFAQTVADAGAHELFGLDSSADVGIGLDLGLGRNLEVSLYRSSFFKQLEAAAKLTLARQEDGSPVGLAVRVGSGYRAARGVEERWLGFAQVILARRLSESLEVYAVPSFASDTPSLRRAANVGIAAAWHWPRVWDVHVEITPANRDAPSGTAAWALGVAKRVPGHEFLIFLGNSRATTVDLLTGTDLPGGYETGDLRLGSNITRRFPE